MENRTIEVNKGFSFFPYIVVAVIACAVFGGGYALFQSFNDVTAKDELRMNRQQKEDAEAMQSLRQGQLEQAERLKKMAPPANSFDAPKFNFPTQKALQPNGGKMQSQPPPGNALKTESSPAGANYF